MRFTNDIRDMTVRAALKGMFHEKIKSIENEETQLALKVVNTYCDLYDVNYGSLPSDCLRQDTSVSLWYKRENGEYFVSSANKPAVVLRFYSNVEFSNGSYSRWFRDVQCKVEHFSPRLLMSEAPVNLFVEIERFLLKKQTLERLFNDTRDNFLDPTLHKCKSLAQLQQCCPELVQYVPNRPVNEQEQCGCKETIDRIKNKLNNI